MRITYLLILILSLIISGCSKISENESLIENQNTTVEGVVDISMDDGIGSADIQDDLVDSIEEVPDYIKYNEQFTLIYELPNAVKVHYGSNQTILIEKNNEKSEVIDKNIGNKYASRPELSPNEKDMIYIAPYQFELNGDIYIYNFENESNRKIVNVSDVNLAKDETAKVLKWFDDDRVLVLIGFAAGTVTKGGDLYLYDMPSEDLVLVKDVTTASRNQLEIIDFAIRNNKVTLEIISWDETLENYETYFEEIEINR